MFFFEKHKRDCYIFQNESTKMECLCKVGIMVSRRHDQAESFGEADGPERAKELVYREQLGSRWDVKYNGQEKGCQLVSWLSGEMPPCGHAARFFFFLTSIKFCVSFLIILIFTWVCLSECHSNDPWLRYRGIHI